jgi:ABC-type transport system involved in Fe-S cluster assembly fused permease/ATPase subunit
VAAVLLFLLTGNTPPIMILVLVVTLYLVVIDVKDEPGLAFLHKAWWFMFVVLTHVPGYLIFRVWIAVRRHRRRHEAHAATPAPRGRRGDGPA